MTNLVTNFTSCEENGRELVVSHLAAIKHLRASIRARKEVPMDDVIDLSVGERALQAGVETRLRAKTNSNAPAL